MEKLYIKPLSVNEAWSGRKFKSKKYRKFEKDLVPILPPRPDNLVGNLMKITIEFGLSNMRGDWDNCIKQFQDILSDEWGLMDSRFRVGLVTKIKVPKGAEYIAWLVEDLESEPTTMFVDDEDGILII